MGKLQKIEPPRDSARVALAEAIASRDAELRAVDQAKAALERGNFMVEQAEARLESAKGALSSWRSDQAARVLATASTGAPVAPGQSAREARIEVADAEDALEAAKAALSSCAARLSDCEEDLRRAQFRVEAEVAPILAAEVDRVIAEAESRQAALDGKHATLLWLRTVLPLGEVHQQINRALPPPTPPGVRARDYRPPTEWIAAREALMQDADAALPT
jgi:chromosome segregation ATPase